MKKQRRNGPLFPTGRLLASPGAMGLLKPTEAVEAVFRHACGDWGTVNGPDRTANERALVNGGRLFSVYHARSGEKFWVITEADRSVTTVLLPEEH